MKEYLHHISEEFTTPLSNPVAVFCLLLFIILIAPVLLNRIKIPGIIGLIILGIIVGPHGLNILQKNSAIDLFSTIGLLYIMFMAGLDLDLDEFIAFRNKSLVFGLFTFIIPLVTGFPVCYFLLNYDFNASLLTASMFSTHTLVAYPIVSKFGINKNQEVAVTVGGTIITDTAVLILLAIILGKHSGNLDYRFWENLLVSLFVFSVILFFIIPKISKKILQKLENEKHAHYIFVLLLLFISAFISKLAGLEPIIGAFVSGITLNRLIPKSSALMNRIEFIGNSLFIPVFLISVGMIVDLRVLFYGGHALIVAGTLTAVAITGKWTAAFFTQKVFSFSVQQRNLIFGLSSSHAAATLAIILVGFKSKILDGNILNGTVLLILITCVVASLVTEKTAKNVIVKSENLEFGYKRLNRLIDEHVLVPVANLKNISKFLEFAFLIREFKSASPVSVLSIVPNNDEAETNIQRSKTEIQNFLERSKSDINKINVMVTIDHSPTAGISRISREIMANIVILGWPEKTGFVDKIAGEKIEKMIQNTDKNLFICKFKNPLIIHHQIILLTPPLAEKEFGFATCIRKIIMLAFELGVPIVYSGNRRTFDAIQNHLRKSNFKISLSYNDSGNWDNFEAIRNHLQLLDILIVISARKGDVSYVNELDHLPRKLEKRFKKNSKIIIYPQQLNFHNITEGFDETTPSPLHKKI